MLQEIRERISSAPAALPCDSLPSPPRRELDFSLLAAADVAETAEAAAWEASDEAGGDADGDAMLLDEMLPLQLLPSAVPQSHAAAEDDGAPHAAAARGRYRRHCFVQRAIGGL